MYSLKTSRALDPDLTVAAAEVASASGFSRVECAM
jgi:hypothetical protein